jgi:hypothetical protein
MTKRKEGPSTSSGRRGEGLGRPSTALGTSEDGEGGRVRPGKHRRVQMAAVTKRKLFGEGAKREFLENFAASCNVRWAARETGFSDKTVYKHLMTDERFREGFGRALGQGYRRLEAELLAEALDGGPIPIDGDRESPRIDRELALQLLREHKRGHAGFGAGSGRGKQGAPPRVASNAEVRAALEKRLKAFRKRIRAPGGEPGE